MKKIAIGALAALLVVWGGVAVSHSGGLDKYGCHKDTKTGDYHCHK